MFSPEFLGHFGQSCRSKHPSRDSFQGIDQSGEGYFGWVCDEQVSMIVLEPRLLEFALEVDTDRFPGFPEHFEDTLRDDSLPVFRHKDQMCGERKNYMASSSELA